MPDEQNSWGEYGRFVLKELEKLSSNQERTAERIQELKDSLDSKLATALKEIREDLNSLQSKVAHFEPNKVVQLGVEVDNIKSNQKDQEERMRKIEVAQSNFGGKWTIISAIAAVLLSAIVSMLFSMARAQPSHPPEKAAITKTAE